MIAIVLAAGYATRLGALTKDKPKALLDIGGGTILDHILVKIREVGAVTATVIVSNAKFHKQFIEWKEAAGADVVVLNDGTDTEETRKGAIGDILFTIEELNIDEDILVIAGDNLFTFSLADYYDFFKREDADCVAVKKEPDISALRRFGVALVGPDNSVLDFEEKPPEPKSDLAVYAVYFYKRETVPMFRIYLDEDNQKDAPGYFPAWLSKKKRVAAYAFNGECVDIGTPDEYWRIKNQYAKNQNTKNQNTKNQNTP